MVMKKLDTDKNNHKKNPVWRRLRKKQTNTETTKFYTEAELEALADESRKSAGIMRLQTAELRLPKGLEEPENDKQNDSAVRVMLVIIILMLIFISIIAYFVAQMPDKV
jgi:hypothetical protein